MNNLISLSTLVLIAAGLSAQTRGPAGKTDTKISTATAGGYGVYADSDGTTRSDGIADKTVIGPRGANIAAATRYARASASIRPSYHRSIGSGATFSEYGSAWKDRAGNGGGDAGTAEGDDKNFKKGAHSASINFDVDSGEEVELRIFFSGSARGNASASTSIDVDGDGKADFTAKTDNTARRGTNKTAKIKVKAGANGVNVMVTNEGAASLAKTATENGAHYSMRVSVYVSTPPVTYSCTVTPFGAECAGKLEGASNPSTTHRVIKLSLTKGFPDAVGVMVIGKTKISAALPGTSCLLLVDPTIMSVFQTNAKGERTQYLRAPLNSTGSLFVQDVLLKLDAKGATFGSSNGLEIVCKKN